VVLDAGRDGHIHGCPGLAIVGRNHRQMLAAEYFGVRRCDPCIRASAVAAGKAIRQGGLYASLQASCTMCASLAQRKISIDVMLAEGDLVAVRSTWSGIYTGIFGELAWMERRST